LSSRCLQILQPIAEIGSESDSSSHRCSGSYDCRQNL
jgi:hypothetical protein